MDAQEVKSDKAIIEIAINSLRRNTKKNSLLGNHVGCIGTALTTPQL